MKNLMFVISMSLLMAGCNSEPLVPSEAIVGKWEVTNIREMNERLLERKGSADGFDHITSNIVSYYLDQKFDSKGVFASGKEFLDKGVYRFRLTNEFEYTIEGFEDRPWSSAKILSISDKKMSILYTRPDGVEIGVTDYKRVN